MSAPTQCTLVWDLPTRAFHWLLALSFAGAYATSESERLRDVHMLLGYTALGLVAFRLLWGVVGTRYARFTALPLSPTAVIAYLNGEHGASPRIHLSEAEAVEKILPLCGGGTVIYGTHLKRNKTSANRRIHYVTAGERILL